MVKYNSLEIVTNDDDMPNMTIEALRERDLVLDEGDIRRFGVFFFFFNFPANLSFKIYRVMYKLWETVQII